MQHLRVYLEREFDKTKADEIMSLSIEERAGWAAKVLLGRVLTSNEYGFRGRRTDSKGNTYNGADTYHINPYEIIVGAMPNLGLGQGKHLMDFAREEEQLSNFFDNLSYASGVGHIVPYFGEALRLGLNKLTAQVAERRDSAADREEARFLRRRRARSRRRGRLLPRVREPGTLHGRDKLGKRGCKAAQSARHFRSPEPHRGARA